MEILGSHWETPMVSQGNGEWLVMYLQEAVQPVNFKRCYGRYQGLIEKQQRSVKEMLNNS